MKITRDNYEIYFLDYLEGNLDDDLADVFIDFLQENPDLKKELQLVGSIYIKPETAPFMGKDKLYKEKYDLEEEFDKAAVAYTEGDLTDKEIASFEAYLSIHPEKQKEIVLFKKAKLQPDHRIVFNNKSRLYHSSKGRTVLLWVTRIAAVLVVAFFAWRYAADVYINPVMPDNQVTVLENKNENPETQSLSEKVEKKKDPVPVIVTARVPAKESEPDLQPPKSFHESNSGRNDLEEVVLLRTPVEIIEKIPAINASLQKDEQVVASLAPVNSYSVEIPLEEYEERLLGDMVIEKTGLNNLSLNKVAKAGLSLVSGFSRERFNFETNSDGQITELNFDSRLLAFSIPTKQN